MVTSELRISGNRRNVAYGLLFTAAAMVALVFLNTGKAYAQEATTNSSTTPTASSGDAGIGSGDSTATGNTADTQAAQAGTGGGGIQLSNKRTKVTNSGTASAISGNNTATGNGSTNAAISTQDTPGGNGIAFNSGGANNASTGSANIVTGNAKATGNESSTSINQSGTNALGGIGGLVISTDNARVRNNGTALALSGGNTAVGNGSTNLGLNLQDHGNSNAPLLTNNAGTSNASSGSAGIQTGDSQATGNASNTGLSQLTTAGIGGGVGGLTLVDHNAKVNNTGAAAAISGGNVAVGNASVNVAIQRQRLSARGPPAIGTNNAQVTNQSTGSANIWTGATAAVGSASNTSITQSTKSANAGGGIVLVDDRARVRNLGAGVAISGGNVAVGNASLNLAANCQIIASPGCVSGGLASINGLEPALKLGKNTKIASNFGAVNNSSGGDATIITGNSLAHGNSGNTTLVQAVDAGIGGFGFVIAQPRARVSNVGEAIAISGGNVGIGNGSVNVGLLCQVNDNSTCLGRDRGGKNLLDSLARRNNIKANFGSVTNASTGSARIHTGASGAVGNASNTTVGQGVAAGIGGAGFVIFSPNSRVRNIGEGIAISGGNVGIGNASLNLGLLCQALDGSTCIGTPDGGGGQEPPPGECPEDAEEVTGQNGRLRCRFCHVRGNETEQELTLPVNGATRHFDNHPEDHGPPCNTQNLSAAGGFSPQHAGGNTLPTNFGSVTNQSTGSASIQTGDSFARGNEANNHVAQTTNIGIGGSGFVFFTPKTTVRNIGAGVAISGGNVGVGNASLNVSALCQVINDSACINLGRGGGSSTFDAAARRNVIRANFGSTTNASDGKTDIHTGHSDAVGNMANNQVNQTGNIGIAGMGLVFFTPRASVVNRGASAAVSGGNTGVGNASINLGVLCQIVDSDGCIDFGRRRLPRTLESVAPASGGGLGGFGAVDRTRQLAGLLVGLTLLRVPAPGDPIARAALEDALNIALDPSILAGLPEELANISGGQIAGSTRNTIDLINGAVSPSALAPAALGGGGGSLASAGNLPEVGGFTPQQLGGNNNIATNNGAVNNQSTGSASITTGDSCSTGQLTANGIGQGGTVGVGSFGLIFFDPVADLRNTGTATAVSGGNTSTGNQSLNAALQRQRVGEDGANGIAVNNALVGNQSAGSASTVTGDAEATGNLAANRVCQGLGAPIDCPAPPMPVRPPCHHIGPTAPPAKPAPKPAAPGQPGGELPATGAPIQVQVALGLALIALGSLLRRKKGHAVA